MSAAIVAFGAISAMGEGWQAVSVGDPGEPARVCIRRDDELHGAGLARPHVARVALASGEVDRASTLAVRAALACAAELDTVLPGWRAMRVGLAVGTSSGGMRTAEAFFDACAVDSGPVPRELAAGALYHAPMRAIVRALGMDLEPATLVLGACAVRRSRSGSAPGGSRPTRATSSSPVASTP